MTAWVSTEGAAESAAGAAETSAKVSARTTITAVTVIEAAAASAAAPVAAAAVIAAAATVRRRRRWRRLWRRRRWFAAAAVGGGGAGGGGGFGGGGGGGGGGMPPQVVGEGKGIVKFFNGQKGFGFIVRDDGGEDVFVHISAVEQAGLTGLAEGQPLEFTLVDRGGRVSATDLKIDGEPLPVPERAPARGSRGPRGGGYGDRGRRAPAPADRREGEGTVKFFNAMKGFGFISRDDGQPDAFVHISAVERAGMTSLNEGDRVEFELEVDRRGKTAAVNLQPIQ